MTLILTNEEIESLFTLEECFEVLEPALHDLGLGNAVNMPRQDLLVPGPLDGSYHGLKTSCASLPRSGVTTMRLTSDIYVADCWRAAAPGKDSFGDGRQVCRSGFCL